VFRSDTGFEESQLKIIKSQDPYDDGEESEEDSDDESDKIMPEEDVVVSQVISKNDSYPHHHGLAGL
jgi:hypothetical protein